MFYSLSPCEVEFCLSTCYNLCVDKLTFFGIISAALFAALPFVVSRHLFQGAVNAKFFLVIGAVLALAGVAAYVYAQGKQSVSLKQRPLLWAGVGLLGVYWLSALLGVFFERSLLSDIQRSSGVFFLTHLAVLAFLLGECLTLRDWSLVRRTIVLSAAAFSIFTTLGAEGVGLSGRVLWGNLEINGFTFGNSTFAGAYLVLALIVVLIELGRTVPKTRWWYALLGSTALIFFSPILFSLSALFNLSLPLGSARASSATAIALLMFLGGYWLIKRYVRGVAYVLPAWGGLFVVGTVAGLMLLFTPGSVVQEKYIELSTGARIVVWEEGFAAFKDRPLFGWGPENVERALQEHFDNRLFQDEYLGEIWFDRAHNILIDTLVQTGVAGVLAHLSVIVAFVWVVYRARRQEKIGEFEAVLLYALPLAHFVQLQTAFDTIGSYTLLALLGGYGLHLERMVAQEGQREKVTPAHAAYYKAGAAALVLLVLVSVYITLAEFNRQSALYRVFVTTDPAERLAFVEAATSRPSSFESLRLSSLSLVKGTLEAVGERRASAATIADTLTQLDVYERRYRELLALQPEYYRARTALAYLLAVERVLGGENKLGEAKTLVAAGYELSPNNLLTPAMEALLELYSGNIAGAKAKAEAIVALNPNAPFGREVLEHIVKQEQTFPTISVLKLENL